MHLPHPAALPRRPIPPLAAACAALALLAAGPAQASGPYSLGAYASFGHDSNLLRLADGQVAPEPFSRSDDTTVLAALAKLDQSIGRQRLSGNVSLRDIRYRRNTRFDNQGYTGALGWDWSTAGAVSGSLKASANRSLSTFNNFGVGLLSERNYEDTRNVDATVRLGSAGPWAVEAGGGWRSVKNSLPLRVVESRNFNQHRASLGLFWQPRAGSRVGLTASDTRGRYPQFGLVDGVYQASRFDERRVEGSYRLSPGGAFTLEARLGRSNTRFALNGARNYSGTTGALQVEWQPGGRLGLGARWWRDTGQNTFATTVFGVAGASDYSRLFNNARLDARYALGGRTTLNASVGRSQQDLVLVIVNPVLPLGAQGRSVSNTASLGLNWTPSRGISLGCEARTERRTATGTGVFPMNNHGFTCTGQWLLEP